MIAFRGTFRRGAPFRALIVKIELRVSAQDDTALSPKIDHALRVIGECGLEKLTRNNWLFVVDGVKSRYSYSNIYNDWGLVLWLWRGDLRALLKKIAKRMMPER